MKYCIAVQETLRREIVVEADSLEDALDHVENEYDKQNIILTADDACVEPDIFEVRLVFRKRHRRNGGKL